jgi:prepilin signal peptidase PulO-like enzyme (type II secretory pathway)
LLVLVAAAGLVAGALANLPIERLPAKILAGEGGARDVDGRWRTGRRVFMGLATAGLFALAAYRYEGDWLRVSTTAVFAAAFLALAVIDLENQLLPDMIVLPGLAVALAISLFSTTFRRGMAPPARRSLSSFFCRSGSGPHSPVARAG